MKTRKISRKTSSKAPFITHLEELRNRAWWTLITLLIGTAIGYEIRNPLLNFLTSPLHNSLFYTSPTGGFEFVFQISFFFGLLFAMPVAAYNLYRFLEPAMPHHSFRTIIYFFIASVVAMIIGVLFAYYLSLPIALHFFNSFESSKIQSLITTSEYLSFITRYLLGFAIAFQFPVILLGINYVKPLNSTMLVKKQRMAILVCFVVVLLITPPDPTTQIFAVIPFMALYELSVGLIWYINRRVLLKRNK